MIIVVGLLFVTRGFPQERWTTKYSELLRYHSVAICIPSTICFRLATHLLFLEADSRCTRRCSPGSLLRLKAVLPRRAVPTRLTESSPCRYPLEDVHSYEPIFFPGIMNRWNLEISSGSFQESIFSYFNHLKSLNAWQLRAGKLVYRCDALESFKTWKHRLLEWARNFPISYVHSVC